MTRRAIQALAGLLMVLTSTPVAGVTFSATLGSIKLNGRPGQVLTSAFRLTLDHDQLDTRFKAKIEDWWRSEDGRESFYTTAGTLARSCGPWIAINPVEAVAEADKTLTVRLTIKVPDDVAPGGYWCALTVDEVPNPLAPHEGVAMQFLASVSTGVFIYIAPLDRDAEITDVRVSPETVAVELQNHGNTPVAIEGRFEFLAAGATEPAAVVTLPRGTLLTDPVGISAFSAKLPDRAALPSGRYRVRAIVDFGVEHYIGVERELDVIREQPAGERVR